jgi:GH15 family glucan-1,4-alpha-glucosidase
MAMRSHSKPIEDYGLIGNMISAALVARDGSIDWLCVPHFDSPACFAALLGSEENGRWKIAPEGGAAAISRAYLEDTAVLETRFVTGSGEVTLTDFMPLTRDEERIDLVRIVRGVRGTVPMAMDLAIRFGYGTAIPWVQRRDYGLSAVSGPDALELHTQVPLHGDRDKMTTVSRFEVREGETVPFTLSYHPSHREPHFVPDRGLSLQRTVSWWREWAKRCHFEGNQAWRDAVLRSLITLKLLIFSPTGGIVAAPTTSLPEQIGGSRNWDYRFCWLRDSARTLYALLNAGFREEAEAWRQWLLRAAAGLPSQVRIMYGIRGERWLPELEVPWLSGYADSGPVRVGNAAAEQIQLDVYGELMDTLHGARAAELSSLDEAWQMQVAMLAHLEEVWREPDHGIWEFRTPPAHFVHSKVMCWVAFDRAIKASERFRLDGPVDRWRKIRGEIHAEVCEKGFDARRNCFVQYYGASALDASQLLMPQLGFLPADDPRLAGTVAAIERRLLDNGFVRRYDPAEQSDGLREGEGAFLACSFWLADAYALVGRHEDAQRLFDRLLGLRNDVGLLAEEYDPGAGRLVGNFPQAFSHIGLINTAFNLVQVSGPARQQAEGTPPQDGSGSRKAAKPR